MYPVIAEAFYRQKNERQERAQGRRKLVEYQEMEARSRTTAAEALMLLATAELATT